MIPAIMTFYVINNITEYKEMTETLVHIGQLFNYYYFNRYY